MEKQTRVATFDVMRVVAIAAVVMTHVAFLVISWAPNPSAAFWCANLLDSLSRVGVPLFLMISGALMLNEERDVPPNKTVRAAWSLFLLTLVWSVLYALWYELAMPLWQGEPFSLRAFAVAVVDGHYHFWYLYMLIGLYLITPLLRLFVKRENARLILWLLALGTAVTLCVPLLNFFGNTFVGGEDLVQKYADKYEFGFLTEYLLYYLAGWYLTHTPWNVRYRPWLYAAGAVGLLLTVGLTAWFSTPDNRLYDLFYANGSVNVFFFSVAVFVFVSARCKDKTLAACSPLARLSALSFGVYIVHIVVLAVVSRVGAWLPGVLLPMLFNFVMTLAMSYAAVWVLSKVPLLKRLVRQ